MKKIVIATRGSALALWQAGHIRARLKARAACEGRELTVELLVLKTRGDVILDVPLARVGGKGLFVKEIEEALLDGRADLAVHSMKDVPMQLPAGLILGAVPEREVHGDLFLSERWPSLDALPHGARLGTSSLRRQAQVLHLRPDLKIAMLRGNVETRLRKMREGQYDAIILASAGIRRLGLGAGYQEELGPPRFVSAVGQGALGVEMRADRDDVRELTAFLEHRPTRLCVMAERGLLAGLDGGCQVPIGGHASLDGDTLSLAGMVAEPDGTVVLRRLARGVVTDDAGADALGRSLAEELLEAGARRILEKLYAEDSEGCS
ncbi:MAG: hydroxymethylbilane synthase [Desulfovibrionaceae bacterium]|nr:hydroxymethylbilane synthase [Desulfovibrionaceae bacterium]